MLELAFANDLILLADNYNDDQNLLAHYEITLNKTGNKSSSK